jgi:hypothetical protein
VLRFRTALAPEEQIGRPDPITGVSVISSPRIEDERTDTTPVPEPLQAVPLTVLVNPKETQ